MHSKKPLKVFIDGYLLNKEPQGTQTYIRELYKEITKANPEILFYFGIFYDEEIIKQFSKMENIDFIFFRYKSRIFRMIYEIPRLLKNNKIDFAHFQYVIPLIRNSKAKYIVTIHDILFNDFPKYFSYWYRLKRNFLFKYSAKNADYLLTVSEYSSKSLIKHFKLKNKKIFITPNGVNQKYLEKYKKKDAIDYIYRKYKIKNYLLYVSRVEPRKNQELLIKCFIKLELGKQNYNLVLIGKNSIFNKEFKKLLKSLNQDNKSKIHYIEEVNQEDLIYFYKAATIFVFPSKAEGFGIPPIEAGALKIPVLCSKNTAMSEFNFFRPHFVNPNISENFETALLKIINDKKHIKLEEIKRNIEIKYSWKKSSEVLTSIFKKHTI